MRGGLAWGLTAAVAAAALVPLAASAQVASAPPVAPGGRMQEVDLVGQIIYDTNVAATGAPLTAARRLTASDEIFEPSIHFELARPVGRETVYLIGSAGYDFYAHNSILNRENIDIHPGVLARIGRCQTNVNGEYSRAQSDLAELARSPTGELTPFQEQNVLQVEEIGGDASCTGATGLGPSVSASESWTQNSSAVERFIDSRTFSGSAGLTYQRPVLGSIRLFAAYSKTDYPNRAGLAAFQGITPSTGYKTISGGVTYSRAVGSRLQGSVSLSYTKLSEEGSGLKGFSGLTYSAAVSYLLSPRITLSAALSRATTPSIRLNSDYSIDVTASTQVHYTLSSRLSLDGGVSYAQNSYNGVPYPLGFDITNEKIYSGFGDVNLRLNRRVSLGLDARHIQRDANFPGQSYPETRVALTARATF